LPARSELYSLIGYIISQLKDMEASFGKTKLVKLLYLIDVEYYRIHRRTFSGFSWVFYHYGPYALEIDDILKQLDLDIPQEDIITTAGHKAKVFKASRYLDKEFEGQASLSDKLLVDRVLDEWGLEELNPLLSYVYFHTEPMEDARRGDILDFSKIKRPSLDEQKKKVMEIPAEQVKMVRERFHEYKIRDSRLKQSYGILDPKPRFDTVFKKGITNLADDEEYYVPRGGITLDEEFKYSIGHESR